MIAAKCPFRPVTEAWDGLNPKGVRRGIFLVYRGYIDESYDAKTFVLSCSVGEGRRWELFEHAWQNVLQQTNMHLSNQGRGEITRYHASDCSGSRSEFKGWDVEEQKALTAALIGALRQVPMHSVAITILLDDLRDTWRARLGSEIHRENLYETAYMLSMQLCMGRLGEHIFPLNPDIRITLIHDNCDYNVMMLSAFDHIKKLKPVYADMFSTIAAMSSKECLPLQLADFLAYEFFKDRGGQEAKGDTYRRRKSLDLLLQTGTGVSLRTMTKEAMEEILDYNLQQQIESGR